MHFLFFSIFLLNQNLFYDSLEVDTIEVKEVDTPLITFDFKDADIKDVLRAIGVQMGVNIVTDREVEGKVTVHLEKVKLEDGLKAMLESYGFSLEKKENYYLVKKLEKERKKEINATKDRLTLDIKNIPIDELLRDIASQSKINIVADQTVSGEISGILYDVPLEKGLSSLLSANGFILKKSAGIYQVSKAGGELGRRKGLSVSVTNENLISLDVSDADIGDILDEISAQAELNTVRYGDVRGSINAKFEKMPLEEAFSLLFQGTNFTYRRINGIYLFGEKSLTSPASAALTTSKLIPLKYIKADLVPQFLPQGIPAENIKIVKEQNAILIFGTEDLISRVEHFIKTIDLRSPQVLIEAMIVEFSKSASQELGFRGLYARSDTINRIFPRLTYSATGDDINPILDKIGEYFNVAKLGRVPEDFWLSIDVLETKGKAKVKARPRIATLNGNEASIDVGWVRYYRTTTGTPEAPIYQLHSIDAGIRLKIVPWVSTAGEITTVIQTEVSNLKSLGPEGLPEIARRQISTTVNLKDGETIGIGGLIQTSNVESRESIPILGDIPIIGRLFSHTTTTQEETELVIYITPRVME
ncbi:MAG: secretin and TonB N-terminal domain-containing protein [candidate division WOR-3 bacterium]